MLLLTVLTATLLGAGVSTPDASASEELPPVILPRTEQRVLEASSNGIAYKLYVSLPRDYEAPAESERRYPVLYLLDADYSFAIARNVVEHLSDRDHLSRMIVVGIAYDGPDAYRRHRTRDYTPTHVPTGGYGAAYQAFSGGGPAFRDFLASELIPFVENHYRASERRYLVGHSYGGLFATWVALTMPELFSGYVIVSPSLWYDDGMIFELESEVATAREDLPVGMALTVGAREGNSERDMVGDLERLTERLRGRGYPNLRLYAEVADGETHNSVFPRALSNGLRLLVEGGR